MSGILAASVVGAIVIIALAYAWRKYKQLQKEDAGPLTEMVEPTVEPVTTEVVDLTALVEQEPINFEATIIQESAAPVKPARTEPRAFVATLATPAVKKPRAKKAAVTPKSPAKRKTTKPK